MMIALPTHRQAKDQAKRLRRALADRGFDSGHAQTLDLVAAVHGVRDWNTLAGLAPAAMEPSAGAVVPILRMFDWEPARSFYLDFLGWSLDGEHRLENDHLPRYVRLSGPNGVRVHLSEHHGDGTPGSAILIEVPDAAAFHADLERRDYGYAKPGLEDSAAGRTLTVHDPSGNRITFLEPHGARPATERVPDDLPPIVHEVQVSEDPDAAFIRFTSFSWWREYGLHPDGTVVIENDEVIFRNPDGEFSIGTVIEWQPGRKYAQTFTLAQDPDYPTKLTVFFIPQDGGTLVQFQHGGWNATNASRRGHFAEWPIILARFAGSAA